MTLATNWPQVASEGLQALVLIVLILAVTGAFQRRQR